MVKRKVHENFLEIMLKVKEQNEKSRIKSNRSNRSSIPTNGLFGTIQERSRQILHRLWNPNRHNKAC